MYFAVLSFEVSVCTIIYDFMNVKVALIITSLAVSRPSLFLEARNNLGNVVQLHK